MVVEVEVEVTGVSVTGGESTGIVSESMEELVKLLGGGSVVAGDPSSSFTVCACVCCFSIMLHRIRLTVQTSV